MTSCVAASTELTFYPHKIGKKDLFDQVLPVEIMLKIFSFLDARSLAKCGKVSRRWREVASTELLWKAVSLKNVFPSLKVFDASDWLIHFGLKVKDPPRHDLRAVIKHFSQLAGKVERDAGWTLLTIPNGLTFNQLVELAKTPLQGNATPFSYIWEEVSKTMGDIPTSQTVQILISRHVLKGSRTLSVADQEALVERMGCEMPKLIEAVALLVVTFVSSGERLYKNDPWAWAYTRCEEQLAGLRLIVGDFPELGVDNNTFDGPYYGVGGVVREF